MKWVVTFKCRIKPCYSFSSIMQIIAIVLHEDIPQVFDKFLYIIYSQILLSRTWWDRKKTSRYPRIRDVKGKILKEQMVGTYQSLWHIHCIRDTEIQLYFYSACCNGLLMIKHFSATAVMVSSSLPSTRWQTTRTGSCIYCSRQTVQDGRFSGQSVMRIILSLSKTKVHNEQDYFPTLCLLYNKVWL